MGVEDIKYLPDGDVKAKMVLAVKVPEHPLKKAKFYTNLFITVVGKNHVHKLQYLKTNTLMTVNVIIENIAGTMKLFALDYKIGKTLDNGGKKNGRKQSTEY